MTLNPAPGVMTGGIGRLAWGVCSEGVDSVTYLDLIVETRGSFSH